MHSECQTEWSTRLQEAEAAGWRESPYHPLAFEDLLDPTSIEYDRLIRPRLQQVQAEAAAEARVSASRQGQANDKYSRGSERTDFCFLGSQTRNLVNSVMELLLKDSVGPVSAVSEVEKAQPSKQLLRPDASHYCLAYSVLSCTIRLPSLSTHGLSAILQIVGSVFAKTR